MKNLWLMLPTIFLLLPMKAHANIDLDDFKLRNNISHSYSCEQSELTIVIKNTRVSCQSGTAPLGRLVGSFPNPNYQPYHQNHEGFKPGGQSPYCLVYSVD